MGQISFGHAAFFGVGAYASAMLFTRLKTAGGEIGMLDFFLSLAGRAAGGRIRGADRRFLLRAADRHLLRHAVARVRRAAVLHRVLLVQLHQGRRRHPGPAAAVVFPGRGQLLLPDARDRDAGAARDVAHHRVAVRLHHAHAARQPASRGVPRHQRAPAHAHQLRDRGQLRRARRRAVGAVLAQRQPRAARLAGVGHRGVHDADRRRGVVRRAAARLRDLHVAAGRGEDVHRATGRSPSAPSSC